MIMRSDRIFDEIEIRIWEFSKFTMMRIKELLVRYQLSIRKFTLIYSTLTEAELFEFLQPLTDLREIQLEMNLSDSYESNDRLSHLKSLESFTCNGNAAALTLELPRNILVKFTISSSLFNALMSPSIQKRIFEQQSKIEFLEFSNIPLNPVSLSLLNLKHLKLNIASRENIKLNEILQSQPNLQSLHIDSCIHKEDIDEIYKLNHLKSLAVDIKELDCSSIEKFNSLRLLRNLRVI